MDQRSEGSEFESQNGLKKEPSLNPDGAGPAFI